MEKKIIFTVLILVCSFIGGQHGFAQLKVDSTGNIMAGKSLKLGVEQVGGRLHIGDPDSYGPEDGAGGYWALEWYDGGLNFWNIWSSTHVGRDYDIFIDYETGAVGIGRKPSSGFRLDVNGSIASYGVNISSDKKLKKNIKKINADYSKIFNLQGKKYNYIKTQASKSFDSKNNSLKEFTETEDSKVSIGFIAQEVQELFPELVSENDEGYLSIDYVGLVTYMLEALKVQNQEIQDLKTSIIKTKSASSGILTSVAETEGGIGSLLNQNIPNPFTNNTKISYQLAKDVSSAQIMVFDMNGGLIRTFPLSLQSNELIIQGSSFNAGMYIYALICDNKEIDSKRMILTK